MPKQQDKRRDIVTQQVLDFMWQQRDSRQPQPSMPEIAAHFRFALNTAKFHLDKLEESGAIYYHRSESGIRLPRAVELRRREFQ